MVINEFWTKIFVYGYIVLAVIASFILLIIFQKREKFNFDERQMLARNKAYKYTFTFLLFYNTVCCIFDSLKIKWATPGVLLFIGILLSVTIFNVICILENAYEKYNKKINSKSNLIIFLSLGFVDIINFFSNLTSGMPFITDGLLNENILPLFVSIFFLSVPVAQFVKKQMDKKKADDEE